MSMVLALLIFGIAVAGLVVACVAVHKAYETTTTSSTLVNAKLQQPVLVGGTPTIARNSGAGMDQQAIGTGSNNSSGTILGHLTTTQDTSVFQVNFSTPFSLVPSSVTLTYASQDMKPNTFIVSSVTAAHFTFTLVRANTTDSGLQAVQLYYLVL